MQAEVRTRDIEAQPSLVCRLNPSGRSTAAVATITTTARDVTASPTSTFDFPNRKL
jgi:hypothetical protein